MKYILKMSVFPAPTDDDDDDDDPMTGKLTRRSAWKCEGQFTLFV
jgi:hypothetical protein